MFPRLLLAAACWLCCVGALRGDEELGKAGIFPNAKLEIGGQERSYRLVVPKKLDLGKPAPLVFAFHGLGDSKDLMALYSRLDRAAEKHGFILAYPNARNRSWPLVAALAKDDLAFFDALYERVGKEYKIDRSRVFVTGMSNGAYFSHLLAAQRSERIAAIAAHSGGLGLLTREPKVERKYAVLLIHGDADMIVKVGESRKARDAYAKWGYEVEYLEVKGLNHFWAHRANINDKIWEFFEKHAMKAAP